MKTITLFDEEMSITKEYDKAICIWETQGSNLDDYEFVFIKLGQPIYNVKILESGSIIFTNSKESTTNIITMFPQMFGFPTDEQMEEVDRLEKLISESQDNINDIYSSIERTGHTKIDI
jgi:hypothetical protein